jgi:NAD(P)-dependent dehydrogenase (short-subunit alcohol dehydrogenase family)
MPRVVIVTGASRGIGAATSKLLADRGFRVAVNYRSSAAQADEVVAAITSGGGEAVGIKADVTVPAEVTAMLKQVNDSWGTVDALVHNALTPYAVTSFADLTWEQLSRKLDQELHAAYLMTKAVVPGMISQSYGRMVFLTAGLSRRPRSGMINLGTAKAALDQFVRYIAQELAPHGITANLVAPSTVDDTELSTQLPEHVRSELSKANPMGRLVRPEEVARTIAFFAGEDASFTTGSYAPVNGGLSMD